MCFFEVSKLIWVNSFVNLFLSLLCFLLMVFIFDLLSKVWYFESFKVSCFLSFIGCFVVFLIVLICVLICFVSVLFNIFLVSFCKFDMFECVLISWVCSWGFVFFKKINWVKDGFVIFLISVLVSVLFCKSIGFFFNICGINCIIKLVLVVLVKKENIFWWESVIFFLFNKVVFIFFFVVFLMWDCLVICDILSYSIKLLSFLSVVKLIFVFLLLNVSLWRIVFFCVFLGERFLIVCICFLGFGFWCEGVNIWLNIILFKLCYCIIIILFIV